MCVWLVCVNKNSFTTYDSPSTPRLRHHESTSLLFGHSNEALPYSDLHLALRAVEAHYEESVNRTKDTSRRHARRVGPAAASGKSLAAAPGIGNTDDGGGSGGSGSGSGGGGGGGGGGATAALGGGLLGLGNTPSKSSIPSVALGASPRIPSSDGAAYKSNGSSGSRSGNAGHPGSASPPRSADDDSDRDLHNSSPTTGAAGGKSSSLRSASRASFRYKRMVEQAFDAVVDKFGDPDVLHNTDNEQLQAARCTLHRLLVDRAKSTVSALTRQLEAASRAGGTGHQFAVAQRVIAAGNALWKGTEAGRMGVEETVSALALLQVEEDRIQVHEECTLLLLLQGC